MYDCAGRETSGPFLCPELAPVALQDAILGALLAMPG